MIRRRSAALFFLVLLATAGCPGSGTRADASARLDVAVSPTPATVGPARILIALTDSAGSPVTGATIRVGAVREGSGEEAAGDTALEATPGRYAAGGFWFPSAGRWNVHVRARLPDGREVETRHPILVVGPPTF